MPPKQEFWVAQARRVPNDAESSNRKAYLIIFLSSFSWPQGVRLSLNDRHLLLSDLHHLLFRLLSSSCLISLAFLPSSLCSVRLSAVEYRYWLRKHLRPDSCFLYLDRCSKFARYFAFLVWIHAFYLLYAHINR